MSHQDQFHKPKRNIVYDVVNLCNKSPEAINEIAYLLQKEAMLLKDLEIEANKAARISAEVLYITQKDVKKKNLGTYKFMLRHLMILQSCGVTFFNVDNHIKELESKINNLDNTKDLNQEIKHVIQ